MTILVCGILLFVWSIVTIVVICINFLYLKIISAVAAIYWLLILAFILASSAASTFDFAPILFILTLFLYTIVPLSTVWSCLGGFMALLTKMVTLIVEYNFHDFNMEELIVVSASALPFLQNTRPIQMPIESRIYLHQCL